MKIISENVIRGVRKGFYSQVTYLISKFDPGIFAFMEIRVKSNGLVRLLKESLLQILL